MRSGAASTPGFGQGSGGFRRALVQIPVEVPEGSGVQIPGEVLEGSGSGGFRCRYLLRFRRVSVQIAGEVPEGSGADTC